MLFISKRSHLNSYFFKSAYTLKSKAAIKFTKLLKKFKWLNFTIRKQSFICTNLSNKKKELFGLVGLSLFKFKITSII